MATENPTYWAKKSDRARAIQPLILARQINEDWLQSSVNVTHYHFIGDLRQALMDLLDASSKKSKAGTNLPTVSLRLILQICLQDVLNVDRHLGCKAGDSDARFTPAISALGSQEENACETIGRVVREWAMSSLEPWSMDKGCSDIALRVKGAAVAANITASTSPATLRNARSGGLNFALVARLLADQLRGQALFEGLGPCELVLPGPFDDSSCELMCAPRTLAAAGQGTHTFSMVARVVVSTMPCSTAAYVSVTPSKRVWATSLPNGGNTGKKATAYAFPPQSDSPDALRAIIPITVDKQSAADEYRWELNGDEYAVVKEQARLSRTDAPDTLATGISESAQDKNLWWIGLPQTTRLYKRVNQHTPTDTDEVELMQRCTELLEGFADGDIAFELRNLPLNKSSTTAMVKAEDCGTAGAALLEADPDTEADDDVDDEESVESVGLRSEGKLAAFREQCIRVINKVYGSAQPTVWLIGGTPEEASMSEQIVRHLFGERVVFKRDPLPDQVHGLRKDLPGADLPSKQRFNLRVEKWKDAQNPAGLLNKIAEHQGPKFVLVCANKELGRKQEDSVNRRAAIHAICSHSGAGVHHVLPTEAANTPTHQARARQNFIHRLQSALTDVMLAHSGHVIDVAAFAKDRIPQGCKAIYGIQALRKNAQMFSGETPVSMLVYSRINLSNDTTEIQLHYGSGQQIRCSSWMPLSEGLIWLAGQRDITSDERWLRTNFETQTRKFLIQTQADDPQAVILLDWGTLAGLWKNLTDENLISAPALGTLPLKQSFPQMSFVRIRYGINAKISIRGKSTTYFEAIRYEAASKVLTGNVYRDEYATTTKRLVEITQDVPPAPGTYRAAHFIGMMTPRKTSQGKRGLSSFRSVTLMNKVVKEKKNAIFERGVRAAESKDNSSPGPIDISVLQHPDSISAQDLAVLSMGLRLGYPHYDEWTQLPAPLFFIRKIDDYIIKYPSDTEAEQTTAFGETGAPTDAAPRSDFESDSDEVNAVVPEFELVSQMVQHDLNLEVEPVAMPPAQEQLAAPDSEPDVHQQLLCTAVEVVPDLNSILDDGGMHDSELLLGLAKTVSYPALIPFYGAEGQRRRKLFNGMMRGDFNVTVEVPYFVSLPQIFSSYPKPDKTSINRAWRQLRADGSVRQAGQSQPSDFTGWLAEKMRHPQGAYITNASELFGKTFILPQIDAMVVEHNAQATNPDEKIYADASGVDLMPIVTKACAQQDDEVLGWLVFCAAQCPSLGIASSVMGNLSCVPGPRTKAALAYYVQCAQALNEGLALSSGSSTTKSGHIRLIRPSEFSASSATVLTIVARAAQAATGGASAAMHAKAGLPHGTAVALLATTVPVTPCDLEEPPAAEPTETDIADPVVKIKSEITQLLDCLEPGQEKFTDEIVQIRSLLDDLERIDDARKQDVLRFSEVLLLCTQASAKAQELLDRIGAIDQANIAQSSTYQPTVVTQDLLETMRKELASIEEAVRTAEETNVSLQNCVAEIATVPEAERRRHARVITALDMRLEGELEAILTQVDGYGCYTRKSPDGPDDGQPGRAGQQTGPTSTAVVATAAGITGTAPLIATLAPSLAPIHTSPAESISPEQPGQKLSPPAQTAAPIEPLSLAQVGHTQAIQEINEDASLASAPDEQTIEVLPAANAMPAMNVEIISNFKQTLEEAPQQIPAAASSLKESVKDATAGEDKELERSLFNLRALIDKRHFGLASVYTDAIETTFGEQKESGLNYALLQALTLELESVDCNSMVQPKFNQWQTLMFDEIPAADGIPQAIGMLGAGLASAIFYDPGHGNADPLWVVLGAVQATLQDQSSLAALIEHVATREKTSVTLTQNKLILSYASTEDRITAKLENYHNRAKNWQNDASMHTKWSHTGFSRAHDFIYSPEAAVGKCIALVAKDDVKGLKQAFKDAHSKFRKPKATIQEAFRKIRDRTEINGGYLVHAMNNLEVTESFLKEYIELSEQKSDKGASHPLLTHEREYIKSLHARLKDSIVEVDEIIVSGKTWTNLESIYLQAGRNLMQAVMRLFDDSKSDACIPLEIQRLLIQQPMGTDFVPSFKADSAFNLPALLQGDALIESINDLLLDELSDVTHPIAKESMDRLLQSAQHAHISNNRFLPAWRIESLLGRPKNRTGTADQQPSLLNQYSRACTDLQRKLQEMRQRVTHAMALAALPQKDASNMLYTVSSIESVLKQGLGRLECRSPTFPDFPHAYFHINESITKKLDSCMQEATEKLQVSLQNLRDLKGAEIYKDADRIERMLATKKPADLRAAYDAISLLKAGQKLPTNSPQRTQETPKQFEALVADVCKIQRPKEGMLESLIHLLQQAPAQTDPAFVSHLSEDQRREAVCFIDGWIDLCSSRGDVAAQKVSDMFAALGLGVPRFAPESTARGNAPARLEFPPNPFARLSSDCFIPPQLGSQQTCLPVYSIHGSRPDNEISNLIHDLANNPVVIIARTTMSLSKRLRAVNAGAAVILIEDFLIAFMALYPAERAQKMLEIGLLNFQTNPYSAEGAHVAREMFFGRQAELSTLRNVKNAAILYGGRRLGKSSLLARIERDENRPDSGRRALYIPMNKDYSGNDHVLFAWRSIYDHLVTRQIISQMPGATDSAQVYADWIESCLVSSPTKHCYLLLDEADDLMAAELELPHGRPGFIRSLQNVSESLASRGVTLRYCIAGLHNLARMTTEVNSALGKAETIALEPFTSDEDIMRGIELITKPMAALGFYFDADSGDLPLRIMSVCNFYPAFIQIYCRKLLSYMHNKRAGGQPYCLITLEDIERVESDHDLLADLSKKFSMTLDLDTRYKAIALVLACAYYNEIENGTSDGATMQVIREECETFVSTHFRNINTSAFESLLDEMRKLNVLEKSGNKYRLRNPSIAMLLGDKERVESQIQDLALLPPSRSLKHGEKRVQLQVSANSKTSPEPLPIFPMPISWIHAQIGGIRTLDGSLPILCGNAKSGLREITTPKFAAKLTQTDHLYCHPVPYSEMSSFMRTKVGAGLVPPNGNLLLMSASTAWKTSEINSFSSLASRIASNRIQLALSALPPRLWEIVCYLKEQQKKGAASLLGKCSLVPVPPYSIDAIQFQLGDNRAVADSREACESILYATCGFGQLVQKHCNESMTVERAASLLKEAEAGFASSLQLFYEAVAMPVDVIPVAHLQHMEACLILIDKEKRTANILDDINDLMRDKFPDQLDLDPFDLMFLQWMGLLQEGAENTWHVPPLYCRLLSS